MKQILCSTGALIGRPNDRDYRLLEKFATELTCDGFEFMVYSSWYMQLDKMLKYLKGLQLNIPVIHCQKALGETLTGKRVWFENGQFKEYVLTAEEDRDAFQRGLEELALNLRVAGELGAKKMVLHLWNGLPSDQNIEKNVERFGILRERATAAGVDLMVENVVCNCHDPLYDLGLLRESYPDVSIVYDTKMAEFHEQTMKVFEPEWEWIFSEGHVKHLHINDYGGGYMDWDNLNVLPIGKGHVDFNTFFQKMSAYPYDGDFTVESTGFDHTGVVNVDMLNECFANLRGLIEKYLIRA